MYPCRFPSGLGKLKKKNDFVVKNKSFIWNFELNNLKYKSVYNADKSKYRITLVHKVTGEVLHFKNHYITFKPEIQQLIPTEGGVIESASKCQLLEQFGTSRDLRLFKESERQQVNIDAKKAVRTAQNSALKSEKDDASKGLKLDTSYMDTSIGMTSGDISMGNIGENKEIHLSKIAPDEVLTALTKDAKLLVNKRSVELEEMVRTDLLHQSVLSVIKKMPVNDIKKISLCLLLDYMITFYMLTLKSIRSRNINEAFPPIVLQFLLKNYTMTVQGDNNKSSIQVPKDEKEKLLVMILALLCYLNDYSFSLSELQVDLKCSTERLKKHLQILNVQVSRATKTIGEATAPKDFIATSKTPFILDS